MNIRVSLIFLFSLIVFSSCNRIIQGEVGVKRRLGKVGKRIISPGLAVFNPLTTRVIKMPVRTVNLEISTGLPSKEGLTIKSDISILYRIKPNSAIEVLETIGLDFEEVIILPVFRSASADVCARFMAKDMHSAERSKIEKEIVKLEQTLGGVEKLDRAPDALFVVDTVRDAIAVKEARKLGVPVIGILDSNSDPDLVDYPIPGNDDAIKSLAYFMSKVEEALTRK
jgi:hypothetical protein